MIYKNTFLIAIFVVSLASLSSCANKEPSFGEQLKSQGDVYKGYGKQWEAGQNSITKGQRLIKEGKAEMKAAENKIERGENLVEKGKREVYEVEEKLGKPSQ